MPTAQLRDRPVVLVFWAPGCAPCAEELRLLQERWERRGDESFAVLGVQVGAIADPDALDMLAVNSVAFPNVRDRSSVVAGSFGLMGVPEAYFVDCEWRIRGVDRGEEVGLDERRGLVLWSAIPPEVLDCQLTELVSGTTGTFPG